jgi:hypothetical protein
MYGHGDRRTDRARTNWRERTVRRGVAEHPDGQADHLIVELRLNVLVGDDALGQSSLEVLVRELRHVVRNERLRARVKTASKDANDQHAAVE